MLHVVIMAGGAGTRFWPESRAARPKQLLPLAGERTLLQQTAARLGALVPADRLWALTAARLVEPIARQLPAVPASAILAEPCKRDTAPAIGLAAIHLTRIDPDATMAVLPSDHVIRSVDAFQHAIAAAAKLVEAQPTRIVTFGMLAWVASNTFSENPLENFHQRVWFKWGFEPSYRPHWEDWNWLFFGLRYDRVILDQDHESLAFRVLTPPLYRWGVRTIARRPRSDGG